jgi:hypothetical protein
VRRPLIATTLALAKASLMGQSFVEFRGRGFWAKDTPLQAAMYLLHRELTDQSELISPLTRWRDTLIDWASCPGSGCIDSGLRDYPDDAPIDPLVAIIRGAQSRQPERLIGSELAQARVAVGDDPNAEKFWAGVEQNTWTQDAVSMILAAFLELVRGQIDPRYGQLVYGAESEDAHVRRIPGGVTRAQAEARTNELPKGPLQTKSFGPDALVRFVPLDRGGTAGES